MIAAIVNKNHQNGLNGLFGRWLKKAIGIVSERLESYAAVYIGQSMASDIFDFVNNTIDNNTQGGFWQRNMQPIEVDINELPMNTVEETYLDAWILNKWSPFYNSLVLAATMLGDKTEKSDVSKLSNFNSIQNTICALRAYNMRANAGTEGILSNNAIKNRSALIDHFIAKLEQILLANIPNNFISFGQQINLATINLTALDFNANGLVTSQCINYKLVPAGSVPAGTIPVKDDLISLPSTTAPITAIPVNDVEPAIQPTTPITTPTATTASSSDSLFQKAKDNWFWIVAAIAAYKIVK